MVLTTKITLSCDAVHSGKNTKISVEQHNTTTTIVAGCGVEGNARSMNGLCYCIIQQFVLHSQCDSVFLGFAVTCVCCRF